MQFCPYCGNLLLFSGGSESGRLTLVCQTCPYRYNITQERIFPIDLKTKINKVTFVETNANQGQKTTTLQCPKCGKYEANFYELQIRSADEPMTTFCSCLHCGNKWTI
ncbi:DNA-directed RNA polymerase iii subunit rpc10 [Anaeramoeba ignava]|uniref:DNA-directed RNA polymerase subunit n=1 Tax=Anaeramoeba ignava TaxID=1746090 RepID=A0A9Q0L891_ANAIG|nr:DNA-directed RNA polymerase iii subunit rpc10 [Anaeramoeba ignava]